MKKGMIHAIKSIGIASLITITLFSSCKKDSSDQANPAISEDEAIEVMSQGLSDASGGFTAQTESAATVASKTSLSCGQTNDTLISGHSVSGAAISYSYNIEITRALTCVNMIPNAFAFTYEGSNTYDAPRMSSDDATSAAFTITGLQPSATVYTLNQTYTRNGSQQSKFRQQRSFTSTLTFNSTDVIVSKENHKIISGTASVQFRGKVSTGREISYGATITFHGNNTATLLLNNGKSFELHW